MENLKSRRIQSKGSFAENYPERAKDWDFKKNGDLLPTQVTAGSNIKVYWKCHHCGYEWASSIFKRTGGHKCPKCHN